MDSAAVYAKTPKGIEEIQSRTYRLPLRSRSLLVMVDGKSTAAEVIEKGKAGGNAAAFASLQELEAQGFIAPVRTAAPPPSANRQPAAKSIAAVRLYAVQQILSMLGPGGDDFTARLESAADLPTLVTELERCRNVVANVAGTQKAERFWAGVQERLP